MSPLPVFPSVPHPSYPCEPPILPKASLCPSCSLALLTPSQSLSWTFCLSCCKDTTSWLSSSQGSDHVTPSASNSSVASLRIKIKILKNVQVPCVLAQVTFPLPLPTTTSTLLQPLGPSFKSSIPGPFCSLGLATPYLVNTYSSFRSSFLLPWTLCLGQIPLLNALTDLNSAPSKSYIRYNHPSHACDYLINVE